MVLNKHNHITGSRLRDARILANKTAKEVAAQIGVSAQALSLYEHEKATPNAENFRQLSIIYGLPISFYYKPEITSKPDGDVYFRSFSSATKLKRDKAFTQAKLFVNDIVGLIGSKIKFPPVDPLFNKIKTSTTIDEDNFDYEVMAKVIRRSWNLGYEPIQDLMYELEKRGIIIMVIDLPEQIDGFSFWFGGRPYMVLNSENNFFRLRMSMAHELCHLFFHGALDDISKDLKRIEQDAKNFAGAFLLPDVTVKKYINSATLQELARLKPQTKLSITRMIKRCSQLTLISPEREVSLQKQISSKRWRKVEPFDDYYSPERPVLIKQAIELLVDKKIYTKQLLLDTFGLDTHFIEQACSVDPDYFTQSKILYMKIL